ncbi:spore gernimation protein KC [Anaerobacillus alkaliphilus]|uniref:Spore gernimation protein KC n=1 Tax=Anaerobacillus alkaliphilus TaxID=1548597 RepID=A0A4Q0VR50_9BACI|nr:endospore germination permease [Anaerobacillus alkaliphilus]RXI99839.1 spore gernimation protein KC [Anaerobacillus alkaliphilus]
MQAQFEKISLFQLYILIIIFQIGSAVVVGVAREAMQDAWIAILIASLIGAGIIFVYSFILSYNIGKNLFEIMGQLFGRYIAVPITIVYAIYFFYISCRVLRDFLELLITTIFPTTPIEVLGIIFMLVVIYGVYLGPEVIGRIAETFVPYIALFLVATCIFLLAGGDVLFSNLQPILPEGFGRVIEALFPGLIGFPFGEAIVLTTIMALTHKFQHVSKVSVAAVISTGLLLAVIKIFKLSVLGPMLAERATFPLLNAAREISFAQFIERIDPIVIFVMMLGIFIKVSLFFFGGVKALEYVFQVPYRYFCIPLGLSIAIFSILISANYAEHIEEGIRFVPMYMHMPLQIGIPTIVAIVVFWKKHSKKGGESNDKKNDEKVSLN